jgi:crotonobetainyl-CoA:carnitine CoA-transferase CaiB-like acyl-CoA transferase
MSLPLSGIRIVSVEQYGAGPFATLHLADLGAEVIKIENFHEGGDMGRAVGPLFFAPGDSYFHEAFNRNKRSLGLDLKHAKGQEIFRKLVEGSDAVFDNLRGDLPAKLGITYAQLANVKPRIVCVHLSAYGRSGSRAAWPGFDYLMQAEAGYLSLTGEPDGPPARFGLSMIDMMTGTTAAMALLAGLVEARSTGRGRDLDVSLFDVAMHNLGYVATWYLNAGVVTNREPRSSHPSLTPSQLYRTKDGWLFLMCNKEKFWPALAEALGKPEWATDPDYATFAARLKNRERITVELDAVLMTATTEEWMSRLRGKVPIAPVYDVRQALDNPFVAEQQLVLDFEHAEHGNIRGVASPVRVDGGDTQPRRAAPRLGEDTDALLEELGYAPRAISALREQAAVA